jgi:hypothetical protein
MVAGLKPGPEPFRCKRDRVGTGDADRIEAKRLGVFDEGALERLAA